ncbi:MAG: ATP--guanido phosphotransferase, partial [Planctomycetes bacterium]|nr:ATP--guanido phosphotransferase [Planctomycetota bacterium]
MMSQSALRLEDFSDLRGEWLRGGGPESDIVVSSRIRLARNVAGFPFQSKMSEEEREQVLALVCESIGAHAFRVDLRNLTPIDRGMLVERHLISRELVNASGARGVIFGRGEMVSIMINEEDHLR